MNLYGFVGNDPLAKSDLLGLAVSSVDGDLSSSLEPLVDDDCSCESDSIPPTIPLASRPQPLESSRRGKTS